MLELILIFLGAIVLAPTLLAITCFIAMVSAQMVTIAIAFPTFLITELVKSTFNFLKGN